MIFKYLFFFVSWFNKKCDFLGGGDEYCYYGASAFVGISIAVLFYGVVDIICIMLIPNISAYNSVSNVMYTFIPVAVLLSFFYFRHNGRWDNIYEEIQKSQSSQKIKYGVYCILFILFAFGLWFICGDVVRELKTQKGPLYTKGIIDFFNLTYW